LEKKRIKTGLWDLREEDSEEGEQKRSSQHARSLDSLPNEEDFLFPSVAYLSPPPPPLPLLFSNVEEDNIIP
jgi:hypothetical protein